MKRTNKIIAVLAVLVAGSMVASGFLVDYLSDKVEAEVEVISPMKVGISLGRDSWATTECWRADPGEWVLSFPEGLGRWGPVHDWGEEDWTTTGTLEIPDVHGGGTVTIYLMSENLANAEIIGFEEVIVYNSGGVTSADFESVKVRTDSIYGDHGYGTEHELIALDECHQIDDWRVLFGSGDSTWGAGETDVTKIVVTFEEAAFGTYTITYQIVPEVPE